MVSNNVRGDCSNGRASSKTSQGLVADQAHLGVVTPTTRISSGWRSQCVGNINHKQEA
jgi:hypothetical protein